MSQDLTSQALPSTVLVTLAGAVCERIYLPAACRRIAIEGGTADCYLAFGVTEGVDISLSSHVVGAGVIQTWTFPRPARSGNVLPPPEVYLQGGGAGTTAILTLLPQE
jgi:hypothetical protein